MFFFHKMTTVEIRLEHHAADDDEIKLICKGMGFTVLEVTATSDPMLFRIKVVTEEYEITVNKVATGPVRLDNGAIMFKNEPSVPPVLLLRTSDRELWHNTLDFVRNEEGIIPVNARMAILNGTHAHSPWVQCLYRKSTVMPFEEWWNEMKPSIIEWIKHS